MKGALVSGACVLAVVATVLGCGGSGGGSGSGAGASSASTTPEPSDAFPGPPRPWAELSHEERAQHMSRAVLPRMSDLFASYDAERYADFDCATCHGPDGRERGYAMPSPSILRLYPTGSEGQHQTVRDYPEGVRFMYGRVMPAAQALLGAEPFDEATGEGFTCFACHMHADDTGTVAATP